MKSKQFPSLRALPTDRTRCVKGNYNESGRSRSWGQSLGIQKWKQICKTIWKFRGFFPEGALCSHIKKGELIRL